MADYASGNASSSPADRFVPVTKADAALPDGTCRGLLVGTAGTANLMEQDGVTIRTNVPLQQGYNPLVCEQVRTGGTAADIWALY
jgi:hypothetical protein